MKLLHSVLASLCLFACGVQEPPPLFSDVGDFDAPVDPEVADPDVIDTEPEVLDTDPGDVSTEPDVVILTFNVGRLFDTVCDSNDCNGGFESVLSGAQLEFKIGTIVESIRRSGADIALLQEVETLALLQAVADELGTDWNVEIIGETGGTASLDVAVIARNTRLLAVEDHRGTSIFRPDGSRTSFAREFLEVHLEYGTRRVIVFNAHFKSKSGDDPGRRVAEAIAARDIIRDVAQTRRNSLVVFGGDLNDTPGSAALEQLEEGGALARVAAILPESEQWTHQFASQRSAIDHLYVAVGASGRVSPDSVWVLRDASGGVGGSDHAALRAGFFFP
jgi:endonuclease/exonuclease/phosphatase family metal-dependent hydrolase